MTRYRLINADPPWSFQDKGSRLSPDGQHYDTLTIPELANVAGTFVRQLAARDAILGLWAPHAFVLSWDAQRVARAWGFEPKQEVLWVKTTNDGERVRIGGGHYFRLCTEPMLLCTRGKGAAKLIKDHSIPNVLFAPRGRHSEKPEMMQDLLERLVGGEGPFLELYARRQRPGWTCWGDQLAA